jgi:hypothetical protein
MSLKNYTPNFAATKIIASTLIFLDTIFLLALSPALAQTQNKQESRECRTALQAAKKKIESGRRVRVVRISKRDISEKYSDYPRNKPFDYLFAMRGAGTESVLSSERFILSIATSVIKNCPSVSMVSFGLDNTGYLIITGLVGENKVQAFECIGTEGNPRWGQTLCI